MIRSSTFLALLLFIAFGWFMGNPTLKGRIANLTCTEFQHLPPTTLTYLRGRIALWWVGGTPQLLADNCTTYPTKPMAIYLGWPQYLKAN